MSVNDQPLSIIVDGQVVPLNLASREPLVRAVYISLFTWRRARADDPLPGKDRMGWWGDTYATVRNDQIGSRLWLLTRAKLLTDTPAKAREYALESLQWLVQDGVASKVDAQAERQGLSTLALATQVYKRGGSNPIDVRFANVWNFLSNV